MSRNNYTNHIVSLLALDASMKGFQGLVGISELINLSTDNNIVKTIFPFHPRSLIWGIPGTIVTYPFYREQLVESFKSIGLIQVPEEESSRYKFKFTGRKLKIALGMNLFCAFGYGISQGAIIYMVPAEWLKQSVAGNAVFSLAFGLINGFIAWPKGPMLVNNSSLVSRNAIMSTIFVSIALTSTLPYIFAAGKTMDKSFGIKNDLESPVFWILGTVCNPAIFSLFFDSLIKYSRNENKLENLRKNWFGYLLVGFNGVSNAYYAYQLIRGIEKNGVFKGLAWCVSVLTVGIVSLTKGEPLAKIFRSLTNWITEHFSSKRKPNVSEIDSEQSALLQDHDQNLYPTLPTNIPSQQSEIIRSTSQDLELLPVSQISWVEKLREERSKQLETNISIA